MRTIPLLAALTTTAVLIATQPAAASPPSKPCTDAAESTWMKIDAAKAKLAEAGYSVRRIKVAMRCYEAYVVDKAGKRLELFLDPVSGKVVETKEN